MKRSLLAALALVSATVAAGCAGGHATPIDDQQVTTSSAVLEGTWSSNKGTVDGQSTRVTVWFELGQTTSYGTVVAASGQPSQPGCNGTVISIPGKSPQQFGSSCFSDTANASHNYVVNTATSFQHPTLNENTTYHYRLCAFEPGGQGVPICIGDQVFTTRGNS